MPFDVISLKKKKKAGVLKMKAVFFHFRGSGVANDGRQQPQQKECNFHALPKIEEEKKRNDRNRVGHAT